VVSLTGSARPFLCGRRQVVSSYRESATFKRKKKWRQNQDVLELIIAGEEPSNAA
jgi:hypothetical protein